jgi:hypothetical protein
MMENKEKTYDFYRNNALLITKMQRNAELYRRQLYHSAGVMTSEISHDLGSLEAFPQFIDKTAFQNGVIGIISSLQSEDYVLCADSLNFFINNILIPLQMSLLEELSEYISRIYDSVSQETSGMMELEETALGYPTLRYHFGGDRYLCSTDDPMSEAYTLAKENFAPEADEYHIWGIGLGYHIYALYQITNGSADIYVYDNDPILFDLARSGKLGPWQNVFTSPKIHLIPDSDIKGFAASLAKENSKYIIHMPSLLKLPENDSSQIERKKILKKLQITINSFADQKDDIYINFYKNKKNADGYAEELFPEYDGKTVIVIAAGPSLDKNIKDLKEAYDKNTPIKIICVGTVLRKLINYGITPDAFFEMDPAKGTYSQVNGLEHLEVPLILNSSAYYEFAQNYHGKKYMACQKDFELSEKLGHRLFNTGGSVTTLAIDFAIQAGAKKIILLGCDMAFTGDKSHASGTDLKHSTKDDKTVSVKGYYGDTVKTSLLLSLYREWIENRFKYDDIGGIELINSTEGGAYIKGTKHIPLAEALETI